MMTRGSIGARDRARFAVLFGVLAWILACSPNIEQNPNQNSGNDGERGRAQKMDLNAPVNDNVSYAENDQTDWKYVQIPAPGTITVTLGCDNGGAACVAVVHDALGAPLRTLDSHGQPRVSDTMAVRRGNYYIEVYAQAAATDYTLQVDYEPN
jgi:hypothetical protein